MAITLQSPTVARLEREAKKFGCPELIALDGAASAEHLNYLDLMSGRTTAELLPQAVAEFQGRPVLYLVDGLGDNLPSPTDPQVRSLGQLLANRSEHAMVGVVRPGELLLYPVNLNRKKLAAATPATQSLTTPDAPQFFQRLASGSFSLYGQATAPDYVFDEIYRLLMSADAELTEQLSPLEVLSAAGRALFFRFLRDRRIVTPSELDDICPNADDLKDVFSDAERAAATSCWLDETYNGDLLPLVEGLDSTTSADARMRAYRKFYSESDGKTNGKLFLHLEAIMRGWRHVGRSTFQTTIDWDDFDFAHIPIGVLSQVYETFSRRWDEVRAGQESVYYTPKNIARLLVEESLAAIKNPHDAVLLDPACGAGTFLVLAFRHLVRLRWKEDGRQPDKNVIQRILYRQIRGFDVSESALRLAALALYITAIELNGTTRPPKVLKFPRALKGEVLFNFGNLEERRHGFVLGSLAPIVADHFNAQFDVVVGNPPWTRLRANAKAGPKKLEERARNSAINHEFTAITRRVLSSRNISNLDAAAYKNPDNDPDLPFVWRATEWAKPGGMIAMALPGRIILKQSAGGKAAREALLRGLEVNGILNGADLEKTPVWPSMDLPFILLFARNRASSPQHQFQFVTPIREDSLCKRGEFRIDYRSAQAISVDAALHKPWIFKALSVGSNLDVEVLEKISARPFLTVSEVWKKNDLESGEGYNISPDLQQRPAEHLLNLPDFKLPKEGFGIKFDKLQSWQENYGRSTAHFPRRVELFQPPLVIIPQTPGEERSQPKAFLSARLPVAFSKSFYGFSAAGYPDSVALARLLYLVIHSTLWSYYFLTHSSRIGASYRTFLKEDVLSFPIPTPTSLTQDQKQTVASLSTQLANVADKPDDQFWKDLDEFAFHLYGLNSHDATVIRDTVCFGAPYRSARLPAARPPDDSDIQRFCKYLKEMLQPFVGETDSALQVSPISLPSGIWSPPWRFIVAAPNAAKVNVSSEFLSEVMREANHTAASRIVVVLPKGGLLVGLLNQLRFWSLTRARLCGLHIVRQQLEAFRRK